MLIIESYTPVCHPFERLPVSGTMGLSSEDARALWKFPAENTKTRQD